MAKTMGARSVVGLLLGGVFVIGCGGGGGGGGSGSTGMGGGSAGHGGGSAGTGGGSAGTGGGSAGTGGGSTGAGGSSAVTSQAARDAIAVCAWTTGCFNTEDSFGGGAPNTTLSACLATWSTGGEYPWADARACVAASPASCSVFRQCMLDRQAVCPGFGSTEWIKSPWCADGTRGCSAGCAGTCSGPGGTSCTDATHLMTCSNTILQVVDCSKLDYGALAGSGTC